MSKAFVRTIGGKARHVVLQALREIGAAVLTTSVQAMNRAIA
jgi:hypothetical protein